MHYHGTIIAHWQELNGDIAHLNENIRGDSERINRKTPSEIRDKRKYIHLTSENIFKKHLTRANLYVRITFVAALAGVAQLVEQLICNQQVGGSSPSTSSIFL